MADSPQDAGNHRVTLAEIKRDLAHLIEQVGLMQEADRLYRTKQEERAEVMDEKVHVLRLELDAKCSVMQSDLARLDERQKAVTGALGVFVAIGSTIAAAVGALVK